MILFASLLAIYAMVFPAVASTYSKTMEKFHVQIETTTAEQLNSVAEECKLLQSGSTFMQTMYVSRNSTINGMDLKKGKNLVMIKCFSGKAELTRIDANG